MEWLAVRARVGWLAHREDVEERDTWLGLGFGLGLGLGLELGLGLGLG